MLDAVARAPGTVFANMPEEARGGAEQMIQDEFARRAATMAEVGVREPGPNIPLNVLQEIQIRFRDPEVEVADLSMIRDSARARAPRTLFANLTQLESDNVANMITEEIQRRIDGENYDLEAEPQPALQLAERVPVPREIQAMSTRDLSILLNPNQLRQAAGLADSYFADNIIDGPGISIGSLTAMLREYNIGLHADVPLAVREMAARDLETLHRNAENNAEQIADTLNDVFYMDLSPQEAMEQIDRTISSLRRNGEIAWEDIVGPMAEEIPWSANLQHHLLGYLDALADRYGAMREGDGYAKGGRVNKKRKAKKDEMLPFLTRKSPELAEMAYRYGGMI
jgi:hypothetical protein